MALAETPTVETEGDLEGALKALASDKRLKILDWLKDVQANFPPQEHGDPVTEGACNLFIVEKKLPTERYGGTAFVIASATD